MMAFGNDITSYHAFEHEDWITFEGANTRYQKQFFGFWGHENASGLQSIGYIEKDMTCLAKFGAFTYWDGPIAAEYNTFPIAPNDIVSWFTEDLGHKITIGDAIKNENLKAIIGHPHAIKNDDDYRKHDTGLIVLAICIWVVAAIFAIKMIHTCHLENKAKNMHKPERLSQYSDRR